MVHRNNNIWSYLLWPPVICAALRRCGEGGWKRGGGGVGRERWKGMLCGLSVEYQIGREYCHRLAGHRGVWYLVGVFLLWGLGGGEGGEGWGGVGGSRRGWGVCSFAACLSQLTVYHASLSRCAGSYCGIFILGCEEWVLEREGEVEGHCSGVC